MIEALIIESSKKKKKIIKEGLSRKTKVHKRKKMEDFDEEETQTVMKLGTPNTNPLNSSNKNIKIPPRRMRTRS